MHRDRKIIVAVKTNFQLKFSFSLLDILASKVHLFACLRLTWKSLKNFALISLIIKFQVDHIFCCLMMEFIILWIVARYMLAISCWILLLSSMRLKLSDTKCSYLLLRPCLVLAQPFLITKKNCILFHWQQFLFVWSYHR